MLFAVTAVTARREAATMRRHDDATKSLVSLFDGVTRVAAPRFAR
jgi:hypothetical protein